MRYQHGSRLQMKFKMKLYSLNQSCKLLFTKFSTAPIDEIISMKACCSVNTIDIFLYYTFGNPVNQRVVIPNFVATVKFILSRV
jgi:hypothetical protein